MAWRIELFGGPRLVAKSRESISHFPTQKAAAILAYLAVTLPRSHSREVIAELFWPDKDPTLARNSLSVTLSSLRKLLGESLVSGRLQVGLNPDSVTTDVAEFEARLKAGDVVGAANLARAEFLPGFYDDWVITERERLTACLDAAQPSTLPVPREASHNLPEPLASFVGRAKERRELGELTKKARLVTLTGSGGSGKTRLSQFVARDILERYDGGIFLIELAPLTDPALVVATVASTLGVKEAPGRALLTTLTESLKAKQTLLLLDNCEHVLEASAALAEKLLASCPKLQILATSREALGIGGEHTYRVPSLAQNDAIQLFVERASQHRPEFAETEQNSSTLAAICTRLDGIPLAIELAAARLRSLSLDELLSKLSQSFAVLTGGSRTVLPRHQTLRGLIDWSYDLLTESEKTLLCRLSIFAGGWALEAAEKVCSCAEIPDGSVLDVLTSLVDKSLVVVTELPGSTRYHLLETVRQYAQERLQERGIEAVQAAHLEYVRDFCQASYPRQFQADAVAEFNRLEQEHDNIRVALQFGTTSPDQTVQRKAMEIAGCLRLFWHQRSHFREAWQWYEIILALPVAQEPSATQGQCLIGAAILARLLGNHAEAETLFMRCLAEQKAIRHDLNVATVLNFLASFLSEIRSDQPKALAAHREGLAFAQKANDLNAVAQATIAIGTMLINLSDTTGAREMLEKGLRLARTQGNKILVAGALGNLGMVAYGCGEFSKACDFGLEYLRICQEVGRNFSLAYAFNYMGVFTLGAGDLTMSRHYREESLFLSQQLNGTVMCIIVLGDLAQIDELEGNYMRSARLLGAVSVLRKTHEANFTNRDETIGKLRTTLGDAAFDRAFEEGTLLTLPEAIALATNPG
jgi:predicted ATPase